MLIFLILVFFISTEAICKDDNFQQYQNYCVFSLLHPEKFPNFVDETLNQSKLDQSFNECKQHLYEHQKLHENNLQFKPDLGQIFIKQILLESFHKWIKDELFCQGRYNLSVDQINKILNSAPENIVQNLLKLHHLTKFGTEELWLLYKTIPRSKKDKKQLFKQIDSLENELFTALQRREKNRQKDSERKIELARLQELEVQKKLEIKRLEEQKLRHLELQKLNKKYDVNLLKSESGYESLYQQKREDALNKTKQNGYAKYGQNHELDEKTCLFLNNNNIDDSQFKNLPGTAFQHQLYDEIAQSYSKIAQVCIDSNLSETIFSSEIVDFGQAAFLATNLELFDLAIALNNLIEFLAETTVSICKGVINSAFNFVDMYILHPVQTAQQILDLLEPIANIFAKTVAVLLPKQIIPEWKSKLIADGLKTDFNNFENICLAVNDELFEWYKTSTTQEKIQIAFQTATDFVGITKLLSGIAKGLLNFSNKVAVFNVAKNACGLVKSYNNNLTNSIKNCVKNSEQIATTIGEISSEELKANNLKDSLLNLMESESDKVFQSRLPYDIWPVSKIINKVKFYKNMIPAHEEELLANIKYLLEKKLSKINEPISDKIRKIFSNMNKIIGCKIENINFDVEHMINFGYKLEKDSTTGAYSLSSYGGHIAGSSKQLEKAGLIVIKEEKMLKYGCRSYLSEDVITGQIIYKTEFPKGWDVEKILEKVCESFDNLKISKNAKDGRIIRFCNTNEGLDLKIVLDKTRDGYKIVTAMPFFD